MRRMPGNQLVWAAPAFKMWYQKCDGKEPTGTAPFAFYFVFLDFIKTAIKQTQCKAVRRDTDKNLRFFHLICRKICKCLVRGEGGIWGLPLFSQLFYSKRHEN